MKFSVYLTGCHPIISKNSFCLGSRAGVIYIYIYSLNKLCLTRVLAHYRLVVTTTGMRTFFRREFLLSLGPQQHFKNKWAVAAERGSPKMKMFIRLMKYWWFFIAFLQMFIRLLKYWYFTDFLGPNMIKFLIFHCFYHHHFDAPSWWFYEILNITLLLPLLFESLFYGANS